jgi:hypothetical protein
MITCASRPHAENDACGCPLRTVPGQVRKVSVMRPIMRVGVMAGSKPGICARMIHHAHRYRPACDSAQRRERCMNEQRHSLRYAQRPQIVRQRFPRIRPLCPRDRAVFAAVGSVTATAFSVIEEPAD